MPIAFEGQLYKDSYDLEMNRPIEAPGEAQSGGGMGVQGQENNAPAGNVVAKRGLLEQGNIDIHKRPVVKNPDGSISTVRTISIGTDKGEVVIPTVSDDGRIMEDEEAKQTYFKTGKHLGIFDNPDNATAYAKSLHNQQAEEYLPKRGVIDNLLGLTGERYQTWPEKAVRGAISAMALPGDVLSGKVQPGSPQEIERAMDLAGVMVFGPAPVASKMAEGTLGSFAGVTSKGLDRNRLAQAQLLAAKDVHPDTIWEKTGFFKGADDRWRYEIPDKDAKLKDTGFNRRIAEDQSGELTPFVSVNPNASYLDQILDHPELFKAYPHLKNIEVGLLPKEIADRGVIGQMSEGKMYLKEDLHPEFVRSVILHELQHGIQSTEKFARGGNSGEFTHPNLEKAKKIYEDAIAQGGDPKSDALRKAKEILDEEKDKAFTLYKRLMGEVEARNVQTRMDFDELQRQQTPRSTEDIPRFLQGKR